MCTSTKACALEHGVHYMNVRNTYVNTCMYYVHMCVC